MRAPLKFPFRPPEGWRAWHFISTRTVTSRQSRPTIVPAQAKRQLAGLDAFRNTRGSGLTGFPVTAKSHGISPRESLSTGAAEFSASRPRKPESRSLAHARQDFYQESCDRRTPRHKRQFRCVAPRGELASRGATGYLPNT